MFDPVLAVYESLGVDYYWALGKADKTGYDLEHPAIEAIDGRRDPVDLKAVLLDADPDRESRTVSDREADARTTTETTATTSDDGEVSP